MIKITFSNHKYHILETSVDDFYVCIDRILRIAPLAGMKQPTPLGGSMGSCMLIHAKYLGQPAAGVFYACYRNGIAISGGTLDIKGEACLLIPTNSVCSCLPYASDDACEANVDTYELELWHEEGLSGPSL